MKFNNTYDKLPKNFFAESTPKSFSAPQLLAFNEKLARDLDLNLESESSESLAEIFSGQKLLEGSHPISMVYAAHQFGGFSPQLGDGRALLLGEVLDPQGKRFDVQLKGSGPTAFSRNGDGLSALGPVIREYIVSEAMHYLGVPTTRALAAVNTGDSVYRQGELPGGVFTRVASSHIRIGTFQYFAHKGDLESLIALLDYSIERHCPEILDSKEASPALLFLRKTMEAQVSLVINWMSFGFIHGVMNTDNTTVSGETIDFGPCAFMDRFKFDQVFSSIDSRGRYSYKNQRSIAAWNLCRLADCFVPLVDTDSKEAVKLLNAELSIIGDLLEEKWLQTMLPKLGLTFNDATQEDDQNLIQTFLELLENDNLDFTLSFRNLAEYLVASEEQKKTLFAQSSDFQNFEKAWRLRLQEESQDLNATKIKMQAVNPRYIPRNHQVQRAIEGAIDGDLSVFHEMNTVLCDPYTFQEELDHYSVPPQPEEEITATFCGT
jgi:serine/tyrosine/threonine adenylyltransferase